MNAQLEALREAGFEGAAGNVERLAEVKKRLAMAYEHFRYVTAEGMGEFRSKLREKSKRCQCCRLKQAECVHRNVKSYPMIMLSGGYTYDTLAFTPIGEYPHVPPAEVLGKVKDASGLGCFDTFEVATIKSVRVVPDPIVFGRIAGCGDYFYVAQWGDDVRIEDILGANEG